MAQRSGRVRLRERLRRDRLRRCMRGGFAPIRLRRRRSLLVRGPGTIGLRLSGRRGLGGLGRLGSLGRLGDLGGIADRRDHFVDRDGFTRLDLDLGQHAGDRRRNLGVNLVGGNLEERLVAIDRIAHLLDPADDRPLGNRFPHLGHHDGCGHRALGFGLWALGLGLPATSYYLRATYVSRHRAPREPLLPPPPRRSDARGSS